MVVPRQAFYPAVTPDGKGCLVELFDSDIVANWDLLTSIDARSAYLKEHWAEVEVEPRPAYFIDDEEPSSVSYISSH